MLCVRLRALVDANRVPVDFSLAQSEVTWLEEVSDEDATRPRVRVSHMRAILVFTGRDHDVARQKHYLASHIHSSVLVSSRLISSKVIALQIILNCDLSRRGIVLLHSDTLVGSCVHVGGSQSEQIASDPVEVRGDEKPILAFLGCLPEARRFASAFAIKVDFACDNEMLVALFDAGAEHEVRLSRAVAVQHDLDLVLKRFVFGASFESTSSYPERISVKLGIFAFLERNFAVDFH
mmetsp:Transcript_37442/g.45604  ORF Transcript_37442/g.45604 Transcript_37442/m.45604 type:complete len:236 (+) Transcript_37442:3090-3797(+)